MLDFQKRDLRDFFKMELPKWEFHYWRSLKSHCVAQKKNVREKKWIAYYSALERICDKKLSVEV